MKWTNINLGYESAIDRLRNMQPHEVLGVAPDASVDEIKKAYRKKLSVTHPDRSSQFMKGTDEEVTKILNLSYEKMIARKR
jgi:DnaJ-class molecular chaperone